MKGAIVQLESGELWSSDYRTMRAADGSVRFQIKNTFLPGTDILIDGKRLPLLRYRRFLFRPQVFHVGGSEVEISERRSAFGVKISFGRWSAEYDESRFMMFVSVTRAEPEFLLVLACAHELWAAQRDS